MLTKSARFSGLSSSYAANQKPNTSHVSSPLDEPTGLWSNADSLQNLYLVKGSEHENWYLSDECRPRYGADRWVCVNGKS